VAYCAPHPMRTVLFGVLSAAVAFSSPSPLAAPRQPAVAVLTGRVMTGAEARPVRRAKVTLTGPGLTAPRVADTDTTGTYRFRGLPAGSFSVRVQKPGFVTLVADATERATLTMTRGAAIEGVVSDAAGDPVWNVVVSALEPQPDGKPKTIAQSRTDDLGRYRLHSLPAGDYVVSAATDRDFIVDQPVMAGEKRADPVTAYYPAAPALQDARPVRVSTGRDVTGIDVTLTPGLPVKDAAAPAPPPRPDRNGTGKIGGVVTDAVSGKPIAGAEILLLPAPGQGPRLTDWIRSDARGRFQYASLPAQRYTLRFQARRYITLEFGQTRAEQPGREIQLGDGEDFHADMKLPRTGAVEGTVLDEFGDPAPSVSLTLAQRQYAAGRVRLMPATGRIGSLPTDDRGHYRLANVPPGDYFVTASPVSTPG